ncbi:PulJ/GspJ family protein [Alkalimonas amylolytica]|uniref:Prepilin-type N-terminal cleavage/methylation domain-containing protein n=1 Tax=Alkalimonas amylolytica TaxID=152573 RepID=A0A1H4A0V7_ALKAM|nr:type II secretion system protein [Alkalimonas amylolytica]SEA29679.1 prepilin-type N-terminal cleavage/methylation domain-containing protein [Alkalimonas amylolytica]
MNQRLHQGTGFTLIEILIALTILFSVVTTGFIAYQTALAASDRANQTTVLLTALPFIQQQIRNDLLQQPTQGEGQGTMLLVGYRFRNQAGELTAAPEFADELEIGAEPHRPRFRLHHIELELSYQQQVRTFSYRELTWIE